MLIMLIYRQFCYTIGVCYTCIIFSTKLVLVLYWRFHLVYGTCLQSPMLKSAQSGSIYNASKACAFLHTTVFRSSPCRHINTVHIVLFRVPYLTRLFCGRYRCCFSSDFTRGSSVLWWISLSFSHIHILPLFMLRVKLAYKLFLGGGCL